MVMKGGLLEDSRPHRTEEGDPGPMGGKSAFVAVMMIGLIVSLICAAPLILIVLFCICLLRR